MSAIQDYLNSLNDNEKRSTVAGPSGMRKAAAGQQGAMADYLAGLGGSFTAQQGQQTGQAPVSMTGTFRNWYTGANSDGTKNGWDTDFQAAYQKQVDEALAKGDMFGFFKNPRATGVVAWDNAAGQGDEKYTFGDVVVDGKKVGNVYDDFDRHTANVMMGEYLVQTGARKAELNEAGNDPATIAKAWDDEITRLRGENTKMAELAPRAQQFEQNVEAETREDSTKDRVGIVAGGALGAGAIGAGIGSVVPVIGTGVGFLAGAAVGGFGAWLNSDSLAYQLERSQEVQRLAAQESAAAGAQASLNMFAQNTMSIGLSPIKNLLQGAYDVFEGKGPTGGEVGGAFYATDEVGDRKASIAIQAADFAATLGDSALQIASPLGRIGYQAQMSAQITGGAMGLIPGVGQWDDATLSQNGVWTNEEFNPETGRYESKFDAGRALAGIGAVGIDVVQLGGISSLARGVDRLNQANRAATGVEGAVVRTNRFDALSRLNLSGAQRQALKEGGELEVHSGYKFVVKDGEVVGKARGTLAMLAPSEGLQALSAKMLARRDAARRQGAFTAEELYQTASDLALGQRGLTAMLVNAVGEGQEEVAQAILEPLAQDHTIDAEQVMRAGLAGAVSGFGMTAGARLGRPSQDLQMFAVAKLAHANQTGGDELTYEAWQGMDNLAKRTMVKSASALSKSLVDGAFDKMESDRIRATTGGAIEAAAVEDYWRDETEAGLKTGARATDQAAPIVMHESYTFRPEAIATSHGQLLQNQQDRTRGAVLQLDALDKDIRAITAEHGDAPTNPGVAERLAKARSDFDSLKQVVAASQTLERTIAKSVAEIDADYADGDNASAEARIDTLNVMLEDLYDMSANGFTLTMRDGTDQAVTLDDVRQLAYSKAVSRVATRDPADSKGSWQVMLPQVNKVWAQRGADGLYGVSQIVLKSIRGDYDGDKMRELQQLVLDDAGFIRIRSGSHLLGTEAMPEIDSTKFEKHLLTKVMQAWDGGNTPIRGAARKAAADIEASLRSRYGQDVPAHVLDEVAAAVNEAMRNGKDVRETVLTLMSQRAGDAVNAIGRGKNWRPGQPKLSNEMFWMANMVTQHLQEFQNAYAEFTPVKGQVVPSGKTVAASKTTTDIRRRRARRAATEGSEIINELPGSNMFRMFQKLHYTLWETTAKFEGFADKAPDSRFMDLVQHYEALSQGVLEQRQDRQSPSDKIIGQVLDWLEESASDPDTRERLGLSEMGDMALMANAAVGQMVWAKDDNGRTTLKYTGKEITLGQHLLYLALHKFRNENRSVWDKDADLKATYSRLLAFTKPSIQGSDRGSAEMAFVTIFEGVRLYDIVGIDAVGLGANLTVGQKYREFLAMSVEERRAQKFELRSGGPYTDAKKGFTIPFGEKALRAGSVTTYKSLVDSLFSAADSSISMNLTGKDRGKVTGRLAKQNQQRSEMFRGAWKDVQTVLRRLSPQSRPYTAEDISRIANEFPEFGTMLMRTIPNSAMPWVFKGQDERGRVQFASWFYEVWAAENAEAAEMSYFRNTILDSWYAKRRGNEIDSLGSDQEKRIEFDRLDSRMHRVMFRLAASGPAGQMRLKAFLAKLNEATSVDAFMEYVNTEEGLSQEGAPLLAWVDDVAVFDAERAGGGWSSKLSTPRLMENISNLRNTAQRMVANLDASDRRAKADIATARSIERWYKHLQNPDDISLVASPIDKANYERFTELLRKSAKRRMANGPRAMLQHTAHLVHGMYAPAHAKGANPDQVAANAALEAMDNAFGYLITAERLLGDLTAHNEDSVAQAPQVILHGGGRMMDRDGSQVEWEMNSVEAMLPLMLDRKHHSMMRAVLFDTVVELDSDGAARRKFLMGSTLDEVMTGSTVKDLFPDEKKPSLNQAMKFLVKMEQGLRDTQKHMLEQKVTELVLARTTALDHTATFEEIQSMTVQAYLDFADVLQVVGRTQALPGEEDPVVLAHRVLKEAAMVAAISATYKVDAKIINGSLTKLQEVIEEELVTPVVARADALRDALRAALADKSMTATERGELKAQLKAEEKVEKAMRLKVQRMFDLNVTDQIVAQYAYSKDDEPAKKHAQQTALMQYVYDHGELLQAAGPSMVTVQTILNHFGDTPRARKVNPIKLPDKAWEELSSVIISVELQQLITVGPASSVPPPYPAALKPGTVGLDKRKYWDQSFSYLFDFLSEDDTTGIVETARALALEGGKTQAQFGTEDVITKVKNTLLREGSLGQWTDAIPIQSIESYDLLTGASANPSISMHGLLSRRWGATAYATRRQTADTVADAIVVLTARDLDWMNSGQFHDVEFTAGNGRKSLRPLAWFNNRFAEELSVTYTDPTGTPVTVDLMTRPNVARTWLPAEDEAPLASAKFKEVNITRLDEEIELLLKQQHGNVDGPALDRMLGSVQVAMRFVNPDAQPATTEDEQRTHANSVWHEGTVYYSDGDMGDSLVEAFFYGVGGLNPRGQQAALDTRKLGLSGIEDYNRPDFDAVLAMEEELKGKDFGRLLALKTGVLMDTAISDGKPIDVHFYNAAYKLMKLKHWVEGKDENGQKVRWSAEQVIAWQQANPDVDFFTDGPLRDADLWLPSDQVLADMMGDIGFGGVRGRALKEGAIDDLTTIPRYESRWTEAMERKFAIENSQPKTLMDTDVAKQAFVQDLKASSFSSPAELTRFQRRVEAMEYKRTAALRDRRSQAQRTTFDPAANRQRNMDLATDWIAKSDVALPGLPAQLQYLAREHGDLLESTLRSMQAYMDDQQARSGTLGSSFWIFQETGMASADEGRLTKGDLTGKLSLVPGEVVFFDTDPYADMDPTEARKLALKRIEFFVNRGVALMIGSSRGPNPLTYELQSLTQQEHGYQRYENNANILVPDVFDESAFQNVLASRSRLVSSDGVPIPKQSLLMLFTDQEVEENTILVPIRPGKKTKFDAIQVTSDLFPIDVHSQFNTANTRDDAEKVMRWLDGLGDAGVAMLRKEALRHLYDDAGKLKKGVTQEQVDREETSFNEAWERLMVEHMPARVSAGTTQPLEGEHFGTGDFVPLINTRTGELLLYRHGYDYPKPEDFARQARNQVAGESGQRGIVMYSGKRAPSATTHRGVVTGVVASPGRGFRLELEVPVQELGEKIVIERNGMKFLKTNLPAHIEIPDAPLFGDLDVDGFASLHDVISKEATHGLVRSFQEAFTVFGIDFRDDIKRFFGTKTTDEAITMLRKIATLGQKQSIEDVYQLQSLMAGQDAYLSLITGLLPQLSAANVDVTGWSSRLQDDTAEAAIARAMIVYLTSPGADVDAVLWSSGFFVGNPSLAGAESQRMPELFTRAFDLSAPNSAVRAELGRRINEKLNDGWHLDVNSWELEGQVAGGRTLRGMLQYGEAHASEDNPLLNLMAQERKEKQSATLHQGLMNLLGTGGLTRTDSKKLRRLDGFRRQDLTDPEQLDSLWHDLTFVDPQTYGPGARWQARTPAEHRFLSQSLARFGQYRHAIDFDDAVFDDDRQEIKSAINTIVSKLGLRQSQKELVHYWIRQVLYYPVASADQEAFSSDRSPKDVVGALRTILTNLELGYYPTYDGAGPSFFSYPDLQVLFQAAQRSEKAWRPSRKEGDRSIKASRDNLGEWIAIAFGQAINAETDFDPVYRLDMSGVMNTYQQVLKNSGYMMDITLDKDLQGRLLDPKTNELLSVTLDPVENNRLTEQVLLASANLDYEDLLRGVETADDPVARASAAAWRARQLKAVARWRARHKVRPVKVSSSRDFVANGTALINRDADMHSLQRIVIALRHGMAMLNPGLYVSMVPEQGFRMYLSEMTNLLSGESTMRPIAALQNKIGISQYTPQQVGQLNELFKSMGNDGAFTSLIIKDMVWHKNPATPGKVVSAFEKFAAIGNKWQDPTWGTTQKSLARHYVEAIVREIEATPTRNVMTIDGVIAALRTDPAYFAKHHPDMHHRASNFVVDFRSLKNTPASLAMKSLYEPWASSPNSMKRFAGTLIKLQAMYATYNMNVLTTMTGMQGYNSIVSAFFDSRKKPGSWAKLWFKARNGEQITDEDYRTFDMSTAIDGVTIANAFIRGGVTQTGLFMMGMVAGGLLSGEDDEAKRRRKLAEAQGAPLIMDPRRLETDFRNKDVIFLDWMPPQMQAFFRVQGDDGSQGARAAVQVSWLLKPFLSPILGMERFFMTGDFGYVTHGFMDAVGSMPLINKGKWDDAVRTAKELEAMALEEQEVGTPTALKNAMYQLSAAVAVYENMLLENMFVNSLYAGLDMYDRDPTRLVLRDSDGTPQKDIENNARPNDVALSEFVDENGQPGQGYMKRNPLESGIASYTENHFTAAAAMSLFTGFNKDYMRSEMPVRIRSIDLPELDKDEAKVAVILATLNSQKVQGTLERRLSLDEVTKLLKDEILARKDWVAYNNLDALAKRFYLSPANPVNDPLSFIDKDGLEKLTKSGHAALFKGLMAGTIDLDDPEMRGIGIPIETRKELERDFFTDMTRQGIDMGLTQSQATSRAKRLMYGPMDDPTVLGFKDVLWDKRIPNSSDAKYKQLNTTYVMGPDGFPWATGYKRGGAPGMGGFWQLFGGVKRPTTGMSDAITEDGRMNSADMVRGIDTGQRGLVPLNATEQIPTDYEQTQQIIDAIKASGGSDFAGYTPNTNGGSGGRYGGRYGGNFYRGSGGYGGGGGRGYSPTIYWSRQPTLPRGTNVYGNFAKNLFWNDANIRRTTIRRERYQASRGRLSQWQ